MPIAIVPLSEIGIINTTLKSYDKKWMTCKRTQGNNNEYAAAAAVADHSLLSAPLNMVWLPILLIIIWNIFSGPWPFPGHPILSWSTRSCPKYIMTVENLSSWNSWVWIGRYWASCYKEEEGRQLHHHLIWHTFVPLVCICIRFLPEWCPHTTFTTCQIFTAHQSHQAPRGLPRLIRKELTPTQNLLCNSHCLIYILYLI